MKGLRGAAKLRPWPHDVLRHCFPSYFHATHRDKARLQNQMGHSANEDTLDKHHRAVRLPRGPSSVLNCIFALNAKGSDRTILRCPSRWEQYAYCETSSRQQLPITIKNVRTSFFLAFEHCPAAEFAW
jgi:hypothetical protein